VIAVIIIIIIKSFPHQSIFIDELLDCGGMSTDGETIMFDDKLVLTRAITKLTKKFLPTRMRSHLKFREI
jgi:hypothetical protein